MRIILTSIFSLAIFCCASLVTHAEEWPAYPKSLPQFQYEGDALKQAWPKLSAVSGAEYPDEAWIQRTLAKYPLLNEKVNELSQLESSHPAVQALKNNDYTPLAIALQEVWRLHFSGNFQQAYIQGAELTSLGMIPAVYSRLMNASLLIKDDEDRMKSFKAIQSLSEAGLELLPGYFFGEFGLAFAKARMLEMMSTGEARSSGYIPEVKDSLKSLLKQNPSIAMYHVTLGALDAGVVERVGSFLGNMTYGSTKSDAIEELNKGLALESRYPVVYLEYAKALERLGENDYQAEIHSLLTSCTQQVAYSAEEALNKMLCADKLQRMKQ